MELEKYKQAKIIKKEMSEIEDLINKLNNKSCFEVEEEYNAYETARISLHAVLSFKEREFLAL